MSDPAPATPRRRLPFDPDAWRFILPLGLILVASSVAAATLDNRWLALASWVIALLFFFVVFFFRDPERPAPPIENAALSPADGHVTFVGEIDHPDFPGGRCLKVAIFLSVFDVHVNRMPLAGRVVRTAWRAGRFLNAMNPRSGEENERNDIVVATAWGTMIVRQIAGLIARRIVCRVGEGRELRRGERFGLIRFGSGTEIYLPLPARSTVRVRQFVRCGQTVIAVMGDGAGAA